MLCHAVCGDTGAEIRKEEKCVKSASSLVREGNFSSEGGEDVNSEVFQF